MLYVYYDHKLRRSHAHWKAHFKFEITPVRSKDSSSKSSLNSLWRSFIQAFVDLSLHNTVYVLINSGHDKAPLHLPLEFSSTNVLQDVHLQSHTQKIPLWILNAEAQSAFSTISLLYVQKQIPAPWNFAQKRRREEVASSKKKWSYSTSAHKFHCAVLCVCLQKIMDSARCSSRCSSRS